MLRVPVPCALPASAVLALALGGCSEPSTPACATQIAEEVCTTPAQLRGAQLVQASAASGAGVALPPSPLAEGRYLLVASSYTCAAGAGAPPALRGVLELSGCVLRRTLVSAAAQPLVEVFELAYASEGVLALQQRCRAEPARALQVAYGFDGERLELGPLPLATYDAAGYPVGTTEPPEVEPDAGARCETLETWELR